MWHYDPRTQTVIGANGVPPPKTEREKEQEGAIRSAIKQVTPTLILVGVITGASFAIGSGLVSRYLFRGHRR